MTDEETTQEEEVDPAAAARAEILAALDGSTMAEAEAGTDDDGEDAAA